MPLTRLLVNEILSARRSGAEAREEDRVIRLAEKAARSTCPVLLEGEPGCGADALARAIHACGDRQGKPFLRLHAGGRPEAIAAALFGQAERAGTRHPGAFAKAHGGTLLIQEVEELPLDGQAALLRVIRDGEVQPPGARRAMRVDTRVVATTHANLSERVRQGRFREDLYYRLQVLPIILPPLRARRAEIPRLAEAFLAHFAAEEGKPLAGLAAEAAALLQAYDWPGNLRQLENAVFRAVALAEGSHLTTAEFPQIAARVPGFGVAVLPLQADPAPPREVVRIEVRDPHALGLIGEHGEVRRLDELEAQIIRFALAHYRGHMSAVSRHLGIGRSTLYRKLKELGLENVPADAAA